MNRTNMARQIEDPPMKKAKKMARGGMTKMARGGKVMMARGGKVMMARGGKVKAAFVGGGEVKGSVDQSMCSPRKQMAMGKK
jgi:hypothetical protein